MTAQENRCPAAEFRQVRHDCHRPDGHNGNHQCRCGAQWMGKDAGAPFLPLPAEPEPHK